jgi:hypothetical protein
MTEYRYLIGYAHDNGRQLARIDIATAVPIRSMADVDVLQDALRISEGVPDAFILSFSPMATAPVRA